MTCAVADRLACLLDAEPVGLNYLLASWLEDLLTWLVRGWLGAVSVVRSFHEAFPPATASLGTRVASAAKEGSIT